MEKSHVWAGTDISLTNKNMICMIINEYIITCREYKLSQRNVVC
jgi:hypothetical protein